MMKEILILVVILVTRFVSGSDHYEAEAGIDGEGTNYFLTESLLREKTENESK